MDYVVFYNPLKKNILLSNYQTNFRFIIKYQYRKLALIELFSYLPKTFLLFLAAKVGLFE
jgi:hypothetical protein